MYYTRAAHRSVRGVPEDLGRGLQLGTRMDNNEQSSLNIHEEKALWHIMESLCIRANQYSGTLTYSGVQET